MKGNVGILAFISSWPASDAFMQMVIYTGAVYVRAVNNCTEIVHATRSGKPISAGTKGSESAVLKLRG